MEGRLGQEIYMADFALQGQVDDAMASDLVELVIKTMEMHCAHHPAMYRYPTDGKGGVGFTYLQPLTESFAGVDSWPELGGAYLSVRSCKTFEVIPLVVAIERKGLKVSNWHFGYLALHNGKLAPD